MNIIEAINARKSIRGFKSDPVNQATITKILETAVRAPSAMNTQPWEFFVVTGEILDNMRKQIVEKLNAGAPMQPDHLVVGWPPKSIYRDRQVDLAKQLFKLMDIQREDKDKRAQWLERGFRFFDAPVAVFVVTDKTLSESGPLFDIGAVVNNICLAALEFDLGTCIEDQGVLYPEVARELAGIPDTKRLMIAIALGYPDENFPANKVTSKREPVDQITKWVGF
ncbi:MAG: nitroreductase [Desulfobacteraceae bacterium]|jgi:nitroreductase|nr:nitroreductase [Desulfobacteraceae bacterium]